MIKVKWEDDPYGSILSSYILRQFPKVMKIDKSATVDIVGDLLFGTKEYRYGPLPSPESQVVIRDVIRKSIENNVPIPILIPWGSTKTNFTPSIDVAELTAIRRLVDVNEEVKKIYSLGLDIVIRVEDQSGYTLFETDSDKATIHSTIDTYTENFATLVDMLSQGEIKVVKETEMEGASIYEIKLRENFLLIFKYLTLTHGIVADDPQEVLNLDAYKELQAAGWRGIVSHEQRWHYFDAYLKLYGDLPISQLTHRLALYLAGSLTKKQLNMNGIQPEWTNGFIQITFVPPVKGLPEGFANHYIYYRTLPLSSARTHICPWRSRGYMRIEGNEVTAKLTSFSDKELIAELIPSSLTLEDDKRSVTVCTNYLLVK